MTAARHIWVNMFCFCWTHVSVGIFMSRSQPSITHSAASTQHILLEIMLFLGHLFSAGSCRCCWQLLSWKEVPATPKSKCFCFHFPVLVGFFFLFRCESKGGFPLGMIGITFAWLSLECGKPCLCLDFCFFKWEFHCVHDILTTLSLNQNPKKTYSDTNIHMHTKWWLISLSGSKLSQMRPPGNAGVDAILYADWKIFQLMLLCETFCHVTSQKIKNQGWHNKFSLSALFIQV